MSSQAGNFFECRQCKGRAVNWAVVRKKIPKEVAHQIWQHVCNNSHPSAALCPTCNRAMNTVAIGTDAGVVEIDLCPRCFLAWFDLGELQRLPEAQKTRPKSPSMPPNVREKLALIELERLRRRESENVDAGDVPHHPLDWLIGFLGLPIEIDAPAVRRVPWITWGLAATCVAVFFATWHNTLGFAEKWGFIPAAAFRYGGWTFFSALFLHANLWHLLGNVYFLVIFGDNCEDQLGRMPFLGLLVLSQILGLCCHAAFDLQSTVPCVGASAAISGIIVYYAISFPNARIGILLGLYWFHFTAGAALVLWLILQIILAAFQAQGVIADSAVAHLGGAAGGLIVWTLDRLRNTGNTATPTLAPSDE
ncbi:MAG: rhomboid family intramembrane serine protease [Thermogutta sp.]